MVVTVWVGGFGWHVLSPQGLYREGALLVKGRDRCGNFELRRCPTSAMSEEDMAVHRHEMQVMIHLKSRGR